MKYNTNTPPARPLTTPPLQNNFDYSVRILSKGTGLPIPDAKVTIEQIGQAPLVEISDSDGYARFFIDTSRAGQPARMMVQAAEYELYNQNIDLRQGQLPSVVQIERTSGLPTSTTVDLTTPNLATSLSATAANLPTSTPTITPVPPLLVEGFETYTDISIAAAFTINRNAGNDGRVSLIGPPHVNEGRQAMAFAFNIRNRAPDDYVGFNRTFPTQDWSAYNALCVWIESDGSNRELVIQFGETESKFWKEMYSLANGTGDYCISLQHQQYIDLKAVSYYGVYVAGPPQGQSIIYLDNVRLMP